MSILRNGTSKPATKATKTKKGQTPAVTPEQIEKVTGLISTLNDINFFEADKLHDEIELLLVKAAKADPIELDYVKGRFTKVNLDAIKEAIEKLQEELQKQLEELSEDDAHIQTAEFTRFITANTTAVQKQKAGLDNAVKTMEDVKAHLNTMLAGPTTTTDTAEVGSAITGGGSYPMIYDEWIKAGKPQLKVDGKDVKLYFPMTNAKGVTKYYEVTGSTDDDDRSSAVLGYIEKGAFHPVASDVAAYIANVATVKRPW